MAGIRVHVLDLLRSPGAQRHLVDQAELPETKISSAGVPAGELVSYDLVLEAHGVQVMVTGSVSAPWEGPCRRCLEPARGTLTSPLREVFERDPTPEETWPIEGDQINLAPLLVESVMLALPVAPLCSPDCPGPDPERFPTLISDHVDEDAADRSDDVIPAEGATENERPRDPRWAALDQLRFDP